MNAAFGSTKRAMSHGQAMRWCDEARDEPRTGDAVDFRPLARDPARRAVARLVVERSLGFLPAGESAFEIARRDARLLQRGGGPLADFVPVNAVDDDRAGSRQRLRPGARLVGLAAQRSGKHRLGFEKCRPAAYVDDDGWVGAGDLAAQVRWGNRGGFHALSSSLILELKRPG